MIRRYQGKISRIASSAFVEESAHVIGDVEVREHSSLWFCVVARGDVRRIRIGANSNIQDATVFHGDQGRFPVSIGDWVTVGHRKRIERHARNYIRYKDACLEEARQGMD